MAKPHDYLVAVSYSAAWDKILLENGTYGFASRWRIAHLSYRVAQDAARTSAQLRAAADLPMKATRFLGRPIDDTLRGGGFVHRIFDKLPADLAKQSETGQPATRMEDLKMGDRVYFWDDKAGRIGFGGIILGNGYFIGPMPGHREISVDYLGKKQWRKSLVAARR
ncbi:MAG TPA: hypothetical protein VHE55_09165 [Fimbriimonadaceae bacterium]|nr:hypothetical protein [Fimbriimonadaceae bacterium]